jgi:hypothetical protein
MGLIHFMCHVANAVPDPRPSYHNMAQHMGTPRQAFHLPDTTLES